MSSLDDYRVLRQGAGILNRTASRGRLRVSGADRRSYLQGLLTNDITALTPGDGCYSAYLTPQGRMIADMRVFELGDALLVDLERDVAETVRARWDQFIFSEDVKVESIGAATAQVGIYGPKAAAVVRAVLSVEDLPLHGNRTSDFQGSPAIVLRSDDIGVDGFDVVLPAEQGEPLLASLKQAGASVISDEAAEICRIEAGRPRFHVDMDEETIPLEAGIEDRAISLTKGCYVGQEIIIRVLHRGHGRVARKLAGLVFDPAAAVPSRGDKILSGDREIGSITSAVRSPALDRAVALAFVHRDFTPAGTPVVAAGSSATVSSLPFVDPHTR